MPRRGRANHSKTGPQQETNLLALKLGSLDHEWLEEIIRKRQANYSTVALVEIDDPIRAAQLVHYLLEHKEYSKAPCYTYDPWNGLCDCRTPATGEDSSSQQQGTIQREPTGDFMADLESALREIETSLKAQRTVFILKWLDAPIKEQLMPVLSHAVRAWAFDPDILANGSLVVLIASEVERVIDETTANLLAWKRAPLPGKSERKHIIQYQAGCLGVEVGENLNPLVIVTAGLNLHQVETSLLEAWQLDCRFDPVRLKNLKAELIKRSELVEVEEPDLGLDEGAAPAKARGFDSVGGYQSVKKFVHDRFILPFKESERAAKFGISLPRGLLLFGPPGTGKTLFARALAREINLPFIRLRTENLYSKWLGESGRRFSKAISLAEQMSPALVFIDEIDRFGKRTSSGADGASQETRRVFSQLLDWLGDERRKSIILGTTNVPEHLDEAFLREGRFDYKIPFLYPGKEARVQIFKIHLGLTGVKPPVPWEIKGGEIEDLLEEVAERTEGFTGAEIEQVCIRARTNAFLRGGEGMSREDLYSALSSFRIDATKRAAQKEHYLAMAATFTNDAAFLSELEAET